MHTLEARTYVNGDSTKVVPESSPEAAFLLGNAGDEISAETAARLGLVAEKAEAPTKYGSMKKAEIIKLADDRGVDSSGTIAEIAARLEEADQADQGGTADQGGPEATAAVGSPA